MSSVASIAPLSVHRDKMMTEKCLNRGKNRVIAMHRSNYGNSTNSRGANSTFSSSKKGNTVTYSSVVSSNIPLYESPEVRIWFFTYCRRFGCNKENFQNHPV
jgi:hypothetical protein